MPVIRKDSIPNDSIQKDSIQKDSIPKTESRKKPKTYFGLFSPKLDHFIVQNKLIGIKRQLTTA